MANDTIIPATLLHVRVHKTEEPVGQTPNILRDTSNQPLTDLGWSIITAPSLGSGLLLTPKKTQ